MHSEFLNQKIISNLFFLLKQRESWIILWHGKCCQKTYFVSGFTFLLKYYLKFYISSNIVELIKKCSVYFFHYVSQSSPEQNYFVAGCANGNKICCNDSWPQSILTAKYARKICVAVVFSLKFSVHLMLRWIFIESRESELGWWIAFLCFTRSWWKFRWGKISSLVP